MTDMFAGFDELLEEEAGKSLLKRETRPVDAGFEDTSPVESAASRNLSLVQSRKPEAEAKALKDSLQTGAPVELTREEPTLNKFDLFKDFDDSTPAVKKYIGASTLNAGISKNDMKPLSTIDRLLQEKITVGGTLKSVGLGFAAGLLEIPKAIGEAREILEDAIEGATPVGRTFDEARRADEFMASVRESQTSTAKISRRAQDWLIDRVGETKFEQLVSQASRAAGTMAGVFLTAGETAILPGISAVSGIGRAAEEIRRGTPRGQAYTAGLLSFGIEYLTEIVPTAVIRAPGLTFLQRLGAGEFTDIAGEVASTAADMRIIDEGLLDREPLSVEEYKNAIWDTIFVAGLHTAGTTAVSHGVHRGLNHIDNMVAASEQDNAVLERVSEEVDNSETKKLSPPQMETAITDIVGDDDIYITNEGGEVLFQEDIEEATKIMRKIGLEPNKVRNQLAAGQDIVIKQAKMFGLLTAEEKAILLPHIKTDINGYSEQNINENVPEEEKAQLQESLTELKADELLFENELKRIKSEMIKAGIAEDVASANVELVESFANGIALQGQDRVKVLEDILKIRKTKFTDKVKGVFQTKEDKLKRGKIDFFRNKEGRDQAVISIFEEADLSTLSHELGHFFFKEMEMAESVEGITDQFKEDMNTLRGWLGVEQGATEFTVDQKEQFARGWEQWLREGKAPNARLRTVFQRFKRWLSEVYKRALSLDVEITNDVRRVFNRMLDAENDTKTTAAINNIVPPTTERMNELGIPNDEQARLKLLVTGAVEEAEARLFLDRNSAVRSNKRQFKEEAEAEAREADTRGVYDTIDEINERLVEFRLLPNVIEAKSKNSVVKLTQFDRDNLNIMRSDIEQGDPARRAPKISAEGEVIGTTVTGGTFPEYFKGRDFLKKETLNIIDKALAGKKLTVNQQIVLETLTEGFRDQFIEEIPPEIDAVLNDPRLNREEFIETYGADAINRLPAKTILIKGGMELDEGAITYGYESGDDMMNAFFNTPPLKAATEMRVGLKIQALEETFKAEDYLARSQEYSDYITRMGEHLRNAEFRAVRAAEKTLEETKAGEPRKVPVSRKAITAEQMKAFARDEMLELSVTEAQRTDKFMAAMKRAGVAMAKAERAKDFAKAIVENEKMMLNKELAALANRNKKDVQGFVKRAKTFRGKGKPASVSFRYRKGVQSLIHRFSVVRGVVPQTPVTSDDLLKLFKGDEHVGEFDALPFLIDDSNVTSPRDYRKISMAEYKHLDSAMKYLTRQGKVEQKGTLSDDETQLKEVAEPILDEMDAQKKTVELRDRYSPLRKMTDAQRKFFARMLNLSYITKALGGYKSLRTGEKSLVETHVTERAKDLRDSQLRRHRAERLAMKPHRDHIVDAQRKIIKKFGRKLFVEDHGVPVPELLQNRGEQIGYFTPEQIFAMAFNRGNDSNTDALIRGFPGLTLNQVDSLLERYLTTEDIDAVQAILDVFESMANETNQVHIRMRGYEMDRVPARAWTFKGKTYRGGYYPLSIDRNLASVANDFFASKKEEGDFFESENARFAVPYAKSTHTLTRKDGHSYPVNLRLSIIDRGIDKSVRYITMAEGIRDIDRIVSYSERLQDAEGNYIGSRGFKQSATRIMGEDVYAQIRPALKHFVNPVLSGVDVPGNGMVKWLRSVAVPAHIALRTITGVKQLSSIVSGIGEMGLGGGGGVRAWARGVMYVATSPQASYNEMLNKSAFMQERLQSWERDFLKSRFDTMTPAQREISFGNSQITWKQVQDFGYITVRIPDTIAVTPMWWGAYLDKINELGTNEKEAVRYADNIINDTQPTAQPLDLSAWFREGGFWSLFNLHQTFTVGNYGQRQRTWFRAWKNGDVSFMQYARFNFMDAVLPITLMTVLVSFLRGGDLADEEEQKDIIEDILVSWALMGLPMANSTYHALVEGWSSPLEVAGARETEKWFDTIRLLSKGFDDMTEAQQDRALWGLSDMVSDIIKVPVSRVAKDIVQGETLQEKVFRPKKKP